MIVVLTGAPGAGKGTQADLLVERRGFRKVSTGDALRRHIGLKSEVGKKAEMFISEGRLVPDDVLFDVLKAELGSKSNEMILLDGYPRNVAQAETLAKLASTHPVAATIHLDVRRSELLERLSGRRVCSSCGKSFHVSLNPPKKTGICDSCGGGLTQRVDDLPEKVAVRLDVYEKETSPIIAYYKEKGLYTKVDGERAQDEVFASIEETLDRVLVSEKRK